MRVRSLSGLKALAAAVLVAAAGSAQAVLIGFFGGGDVTGAAQVPPQFINLQVQPGNSQYVVHGNAGWTLDSLFDFNVGTLSGGGTVTFSNGVDSIFATFTSTSVVLGAPLDLVNPSPAARGPLRAGRAAVPAQCNCWATPLACPLPFLSLKPAAC